MLSCVLLEQFKKHMFLWKTLEDVKEDVHTSHAKPWKTYIKIKSIEVFNFLKLDLRLPGFCVGGVHIFLHVFQHLQQKHLLFYTSLIVFLSYPAVLLKS